MINENSGFICNFGIGCWIRWARYHRGRWTENNSNLNTLFLMFFEPKGQELNTFIGSIHFVNFLTPLGPWGCVHIYLKKCISMILTLNCCYSISANRRKQKDWFLWKNMHQSMSRNWENSSSLLQSPPKHLFSIE